MFYFLIKHACRNEKQNIKHAVYPILNQFNVTFVFAFTITLTFQSVANVKHKKIIKLQEQEKHYLYSMRHFGMKGSNKLTRTIQHLWQKSENNKQYWQQIATIKIIYISEHFSA